MGVKVTESTAKTIYVCSPYKAASLSEADREREMKENVKRAKLACRILVKLGYLPLAPHLYFTQFLEDDDEKEREEGMALGMRWLAVSDELWVFGERISDGMSREISYARELGIPVRCLPEPGRLIECIVNAWKQRQEEHTEGCREQGGQDQEESEDMNHE